MRKSLSDLIPPNAFGVFLFDLSDQEFIDLHRRLANMDEEDQIPIIIAKDPTLESIFSPIIRNIFGIEYKVGVEVHDPFTAGRVANIATWAIADRQFNGVEWELNQKLEGIQGDIIRAKEMLDGELEILNIKRNTPGTSNFQEGFLCAQTDREFFPEPVRDLEPGALNCDLNRQKVRSRIIEMAQGATSFKLRIFCLQQLQYLKETGTIPSWIDLAGTLRADGRGGDDLLGKRISIDSKGSNSRLKNKLPADVELFDVYELGKDAEYRAKKYGELITKLIEFGFVLKDENRLRWNDNYNNESAGCLMESLRLKGRIPRFTAKEKIMLFNNTFAAKIHETSTTHFGKKNDFDRKTEQTFQSIVS